MQSSAVATYGRRQAWNMAAFAAMGVAGVLCNIVIVRYAGASSLGVFNTCFSLQVVLGQLFGLGVHYSLLHALPQQEGDDRRQVKLLGGALSICLLASVVFVVLLLVGLSFFERLEVYHEYIPSLYVLAFSLLFFPANKALIFSLNATHRYIAYSFFNAARLALMLVSLLVIAVFGISEIPIFSAVLVTEFVVFVSLLCLLRPKLMSLGGMFEEVADLVRFGLRSLPSGFTQELNTRVDVLCLALLTNATLAGVYSFVSMLAEGIYQIGITFRNSVDPIIAASRDKSAKDFGGLMGRIKRDAFLMVGVASVGLWLGYLFVFPLVVNAELVDESKWPLLVLLGGIVATAGYIPFGGFFQQAGFPGTQSLLLLSASLVNVVANLILIPIFGILGASVATVLAYIVFALALRILVKRNFGLEI